MSSSNGVTSARKILADIEAGLEAARAEVQKLEAASRVIRELYPEAAPEEAGDDDTPSPPADRRAAIERAARKSAEPTAAPAPGRRRIWSDEQKRAIVAEVTAGERVGVVLERHSLSPACLSRWRKELA